MSAEGERESLKYRLLGSEGDIGSWGHEYVGENFFSCSGLFSFLEDGLLFCKRTT